MACKWAWKAYPLDSGFTTSCVDLLLGLCRFRVSGAAALALGPQDVASCGRFRAGSDARIDEIATGCRPEAEADPEADPGARVESASRVTSSVPSEHELVKVAPDMGLAQAVELEGAQFLPVEGISRQRPSPSA